MTLSQSILRLALATAGILMIPLAAMQFSNEVNWSLFDFAFAGTLLFGAGLVFVLVARTWKNTPYRLGLAVAVGAGLMLIWGNLAVGFIGSEDNPANLLYAGVFVVLAIGALASRLRPQGMATTMFAAALTQFLVPLVAALIWKPALNLGMLQVLVLNTIFAGFWVASGWLFRRAARAGASPVR